MGQLRARTLSQIEGCEIVSVYDPVMPDNPGYPVAESMDEIIESPEINAIVISVPNFIVKQATIAALRHGKHVFCEKPPAMNYEDVKEIAAVHRESGRTLMYGFNHRRHAAVMKMRELATEGTLGRVLWMRGRYGKSVDADYLKGWRAKKELAGGGILLDQGIHMLDLFLFIGGQKFDEVQAMVSNLYWKTDGIEDNVFAAMRNTQSGMCAQMHSTMTQWRHLFSLEVFCEKGYMVLNGLKTGSGTYGDEVLMVARNRSKAPAATWQDEEKFSYPIDESWDREAVEFVDSALHGKEQTHGTIENALDVMELVDTIYKNDHHVAPERFDNLQ